MELFIYLLKSVSILAMFYFVYVLALRSDTHFESNRHFLLAGIIAAIALPFVTFTQINFVELPTLTNELTTSGVTSTTLAPAITPSIDWLWVAIAAYASIMTLLFLRLGYQILRLFAILKGATKYKRKGYTYIESNKIIAPFSFFKYIVFNPQMHEQQELEMILKHEQIHAKQRHSIDLLLGNLLTVMQWINPFAWWYKSLMAENLEFIADRETVAKISCEKQYQLALVKNSTNPQNFTITNHFYQSFNHLKVLGLRIKMPFQNGRIKKRIVMLNKSNSDRKSKWKLAIILPLLGMFMWSFNVKEVTEYTVANSADTSINYTINALTTDSELDAIESAFLKEQQLKVQFKDRERNAQNQLITLSVDAAYNMQQPVYKYLTLSGKDQKEPIGSVILDVVDGELRISDLESKMVLRATQKGLVADALEVKPKAANITKEFFGEDPLYIINEKPWRKEDIPQGKTLVTDGDIIALDKEDGLKEYGEAGKDGVLVVNGLAKFEEHPMKAALDKANPPKNNRTKAAPAKDIVIVINSSMNDAALKKTIAQAKSEHGVEITINDVVYNNANEIIEIDLSYKKGSNQGSYHVSSDDGPIDDIFITINENGGVGIGNDFAKIKRNTQLARGYAERSKAMALRQKELAARGEARSQELAVRSKVRKKELEARKAEMALAMKARQGEMKARSKELRDKQKALAAEKRAMAYSYGAQARGYAHNGSGDKVIIEASLTDSELGLLKEKLAAKGVDFNYRRVKRNSDGLITSIKLTLNNNNGSSSNTSVTTDNDEPIDTIVMEY